MQMIGGSDAIMRKGGMAGLAGFTPAAMFGLTNGPLWDFSTTSPLYSDNLGATPLTAPDTGVGLVADRSRVRSPVTAYGGAQASAGFRPKWGRAPVSRRNLFQQTVAFSNAYWLTQGGSWSAVDGNGFQTFTEDSALSQHRLYRESLSLTAGQPYTLSARVAYDTRRWLFLSIYDGTATVRGWFDLQNGVKGSVSPDTSSTMTLVSAGVYDVTLTRTSAGTTSTGNAQIGTQSADNQTANWTANGSTVRVARYQFEQSSTATAPQTVTNAYDMTEAGVPAYGYIRPDRTDDVLSTVLTLAQTGDVAVFGRSGSKIESGLIYGAGATFSLGPTTVTGMSAGVLAAVGDVVGLLAIGRALTVAEKASTLAYFQARGAGAWL